MDKETKLILTLLFVVIILGIIFGLKVTGVIPKKENINITQQEDIGETNINTDQRNKNDEDSFISRVIGVIQVVGSVVALIGTYKMCVKLRIPKLLLIISFIIEPIVFFVLFVKSFTPGSGLVGALIAIQRMIVFCLISILISIWILYIYLKRLNMRGSILLLLLIPIISYFIKIPFIFTMISGFSVMVIINGHLIKSFFKLAEYFNKSRTYALGIIFLPFIFIPMLGYSKD